MPWAEQARLPGQSGYYSGRLQHGRQNARHEFSQQLMQAREMTDNDINIYELSFDSKGRDKDEYVLFEPREPHCLRPFEDLGVNLDLQDDICYVWAEPPLDDAEYTHDALELQTSHALCLPCKDTLNYFCQNVEARRKWNAVKSQNKGAVFPMAQNVVHHSSLGSLFAFGTECFICSQLCNKVRAMYPQILTWSENENYRIECCWQRNSEENTKHRMWFVMFNPSFKKLPISNYQNLLRAELWPKPHFSHFFGTRVAEPPLVANELGYEEADDGTNDDPRTRALALAWLDHCKENTDGKHTLCQRQDNHFLPTRLLDVRHALETGRVRLVHPSEEPQLFEGPRFYASLSYCWGVWGASEAPVLLAANLKDRKDRGMDWDRLPRTYQDAIKITSWFGWRWLWVDSLCIIQDSMSDWQREASMMDRIYQNAQVTISADIGVDCRAGCFTKRGQIDAKAIEFGSTESGRAWFLTTEAVFHWMTTAPSLSRAWIHRERQLSRRILHFTDKELVWECCGMGKEGFASETMPGGAPFDQVFNGENKFQVKWSEANDASGNDAETRLGEIQALWNTTCEGLSRKAVTYPTDMPVILSSLAKEFHQMIPDDEYVCGLWRSTFPQSLAWRVPCMTNKEPNSEGYIAPTWSWLSAANPIKLVQQGPSIAVPLAKVVEIRCEPDSDDPYGKLASGKLRLNGYLRRLHFRWASRSPLHFLLSIIDQGDDGVDRKRLISADWNEYDGQTCSYTTDFPVNSVEEEEFECYAFFIAMGENATDLLTCERSLSCILMKAVDGADRTYQKIGTLAYLNDQLAFKLRYDVVSIPEHEGLGYREYRQTVDDQEWRRIFEKPGERRPEDPVEIPPPSIWDLLAEYVRRQRWRVLDRFRRKEKQRREEKKRRQEKRQEQKKREEPKDKQGEASVCGRDAADDGPCNRPDDQVDGSDIGQESHADTCLDPKDDPTPSPGNTVPEAEGAKGHSSSYGSPPGSLHDSGPEDDASDSEGTSTSTEYFDESTFESQWNTDNDLRQLPFPDLVTQLRSHPLCGVAVPADDNEGRRMMEDALAIASKTVAWGQILDPGEALYQFDDALHRWQQEKGVFPWLQRLEPVEITLV